MASCPFIRHPFLTVATILTLAYLLIPVITIIIIPTDTPQPYMYEAEIIEKLGETMGGKLRYYHVSTIQGTSLDTEFVAAIDEDYTRGAVAVSLADGETVWMQGDIMTPEIFYGDQYLFFGLPQVYVRQLKPGLLWPDQVSELPLLYGSPATTLLAPVSTVIALLEGVPGLVLAVYSFKSVLLAASGYYMLKYRSNEQQVILVFGVYCVLAMVSSIPILGELY